MRLESYMMQGGVRKRLYQSETIRTCDSRDYGQIFIQSMQYDYADVAGMIDHALLNPTLSEKELMSGCALAKAYQTATVCVKPCDVAQAKELLNSSGVGVCAVIGFPHGANLAEIKVLETRRACEMGASEVDLVINFGRVMSGDWEFVEEEIRAVCKCAHSNHAKLKVILENDYLNEGGARLGGNELKRLLCQICEAAGADWVKTSTGFGYVRRKDGSLATQGATEEDVSLMVEACRQGTQVKAAGGVKDLSALLRMRQIGATRIGTSSTKAILDECREMLGLPIISIVEESGQSGY